MPKVTIKLSSTALGSSGCMNKFHKTVVQGYKETPSASIVYGIAVHKYVDTMFQTDGDISKAVVACKRAFSIPKNINEKQLHLSDERHMLGVCSRLWCGYILEDNIYEVLMLNGKPATEQTFEIPFYEDDWVDVRLCGTLDTLGQIKGGCFAIRDWKTTSSWDTRSYFKRYEMSRQLRFYVLACKLMHEREPDSSLGKIGGTRMGAFIDGIFLKPNQADVTFNRSEVYQYSNEDIDAFKDTVIDFCKKLSTAIATNKITKEGILNGYCEQKYGFCSFWNVCKAPPQVAELLLKRDFKIVPFEPADYNGLGD